MIAIGDVHGDFDDFVAILQRTGLIDTQQHWTGNNSTLVQVGDLLDRGPKPREVMDLLMALEKEAPKSGGRVVSLLGNHEMMNLMGDLRYVTPENYTSFADSKSEARRQSAYQQYVKWLRGHAQLVAALPKPMEPGEAEWMARHPLGFVEQREAFGPHGTYGKWLREHSAVVKIGGVIFVHGGLAPSLAQMKLGAINSQIHDEIQAFDAAKQYLQDQNLILPFFDLDEITAVVQADVALQRKSRAPPDEQAQAKLGLFLGYGDWLSVRADGPLWFRGYDQWSDEEGDAQIGKLLQAYDAKRIVVGHTVQKGGLIRPRFGNRVFLIDTGMLSSYFPGGKPSALEIRDDTTFTAVYLDKPVVLVQPAGASLQDRRPGPSGQIPDTEKLSQPAEIPQVSGCRAGVEGVDLWRQFRGAHRDAHISSPRAEVHRYRVGLFALPQSCPVRG